MERSLSGTNHRMACVAMIQYQFCKKKLSFPLKVKLFVSIDFHVMSLGTLKIRNLFYAQQSYFKAAALISGVSSLARSLFRSTMQCLFNFNICIPEG